VNQLTVKCERREKMGFGIEHHHTSKGPNV
jgi:hypothetical protein